MAPAIAPGTPQATPSSRDMSPRRRAPPSPTPWIDGLLVSIWMDYSESMPNSRGPYNKQSMRMPSLALLLRMAYSESTPNSRVPYNKQSGRMPSLALLIRVTEEAMLLFCLFPALTMVVK